MWLPYDGDVADKNLELFQLPKKLQVGPTFLLPKRGDPLNKNTTWDALDLPSYPGCQWQMQFFFKRIPY